MSTPKHILVTGGTGYIGIHTIVCLLEQGYTVTIVDNLINSSQESVRRCRQITQCDPQRLTFYHVDLCDLTALEVVFQSVPRKFDAVIHFAGLKAVGESVRIPVRYYDNNLVGTLNLLTLMDKYDCPAIVFSSSATVYGAAPSPIREDTPVGSGITNPYGRTKFMLEEILKDYKISKQQPGQIKPCSVVLLRYFNPVGSHSSGLIGEDPNGIPNNLMPYVAQVAVGKREKLTIFGNDYETKDGTGVRDYIHVMDLAEGHVAALRYIDDINSKGYNQLSTFNLGTGNGVSVVELVTAMRKASGQAIPFEFGARRPGDVAVCFADPSLAERELGWKATRSIDEMCRDVWNWQSKNPNGYKTA